MPDIAGPRVYSVAELFSGYRRARRRRRPILQVWLPGKACSRAEHKLYQPRRRLRGVDRLHPKAGWKRYHRR